MSSVLTVVGSCNLSIFGIGELPPSMLSPPKPCAGFGGGFCGNPPIGGLSNTFGFCEAKLGETRLGSLPSSFRSSIGKVPRSTTNEILGGVLTGDGGLTRKRRLLFIRTQWDVHMP